MTADVIRALRAAEDFIAEELECRQRSAFPETNPYIASATKTLAMVRAALDGDRRRRPTVWIAWRRDKSTAAKIAGRMIRKGVRACVLPAIHDGQPAYFIHVSTGSEARAHTALNRILTQEPALA